jgi:N-acetylglucosaminyl-diphospho-decaprenol L-rhamnosyltransferase
LTADSAEPEVTIVVVAHSVRHELERLFDSIRRHAGIPVTTILVDNASRDDTRAWVRAQHPEVRMIKLDANLGVAARDHGLRESRTPYTLFLDSDAALTAGALPTLVDALERNPSWGLVGPRLVYDDGTVQASCRRFPPRLLPLLRRPPLDRVFERRRTVSEHLMRDFDHASTRPVLYVLGACQLFRTSLARAAGPFDDRVFLGWDDADWCFRIRDAGGEIVFVADATVVHTYRRQTRRRPLSRAAWRQLRAFVYFQRIYAARRRELIELSRRLDRLSPS